METPDSQQPQNSADALKITVALVASVGLILIGSIFGGGSGGRESKSAGISSTATGRSSERSSTTPNADAFVAGSGAYMDGQEKKLYEQDPSSRGYTDADRDFLKEHGVSEDEARAAETILHEQGIE